jgi:hypothetical protein
MGRVYSKNGKKRSANRILMGTPEGKRPVGRQKRTWVDNIKMDIERQDGIVWTGSMWLWIGTSGGLL